jgi:hypothetical protein
MLKKAFVLSGILILLLSISTFAAVPRLINFQGKLTTTMGTPETISKNVTFKLFYTVTGADTGWSETILIQPDSAGQFSTVLGSSDGHHLDIDFSQPLSLEVKIGSDTFYPRQSLSAVPYAFYAITAESVVGGGGVGGQWTTSGSDIYNNNTGKVGIGTSNPKNKLDVAGGMVIGSGYAGTETASSDGLVVQGPVAIGATAEALLFHFSGKPGDPEIIIPLTLAVNGVAGFNGVIITSSNEGILSLGKIETMGDLNVHGGGGARIDGTLEADGGVRFPDGQTQIVAYTGGSGEASTPNLKQVLDAGNVASLESATIGSLILKQSLALGGSSNASGGYSAAMGGGTQATGQTSIALGSFTTAHGISSTAMGANTTASGDASTAMGQMITVQGNGSFGIGLDSTPRTITQSNTMAIVGGNVGIGTTEPPSKLSVNGDIRIMSGSGGILYFEDGSTMSTAGLGSASSLAASGDALVIGDSDADGSGDVILKTGSNDRLHILNNGNVGIGGAPLTQRLTNYGDMVLRASPANLYFNQADGQGVRHVRMRDVFSGGFYSATNQLNIDLLDTNDVSNAGIHLALDGSSKGFIGLATQNSERVRIDSSGNVGIGTASPTGKFQVTTLEGAAPSIFVSTAEGKVGIGTTEPGAKLDVAGNIKITDGTQGAGKVLTSDDNGLASWVTPEVGVGGGGGISTAEADTFYVNVSGDAMTGTLTLETGANLIVKDGKVGIGTTSPGGKLSVGTLEGSTSLFVSSTNGYVSIGMPSGGQPSPITTLTVYGPGLFFKSAAGKGEALTVMNNNATNNNESAMIYKIRTDSGSNSFKAASVSGLAESVSNSNPLGALVFATGAGGSLDNLNERMRITSSGNVGIGTTNPQASLDVGGTGIRLGGVTRTTWPEGTVTGVTGTAPVVSTGTTAPVISMAAATASVNGYMTSTYASKLDGITAEAADTTNDSWSGTGDITMTSGKVGIGTTGPLAKLDVDTGSTTGAGLRVNGSAVVTGSLEVLGSYIPQNQLLSTYETMSIYPSNTSPTALIIQPTEEMWGESAIQYKNFSGTTLFEVNNAGNVGIGTTDPGTNKLKVAGSTEVTGNLIVSGTGNSSFGGRVLIGISPEALPPDVPPTLMLVVSGEAAILNGGLFAQGDIGTEGRITAKGTDDSKVGGNFHADGDIKADGNLRTEGNISANGTGESGVGGNFSVGGNIYTANGKITANGTDPSSVGGNFGVGGSLDVNGMLYANSGLSVNSTNESTFGGGISANGGIGAGGSIHASGDLSANGTINAGPGESGVGGNFHVTGNLSKGGGSFLIDHPLDPKNKVLRHSFVESPEMRNIYEGTVLMGENGEAVVELPKYFEALNKDYRYQLTPIGDYAQLFIKKKVKDNKFVIAGGKPGLEVCWMVTGTRQDAYALKHPIVVEEEKGTGTAKNYEKGKYIYPEGFK